MAYATSAQVQAEFKGMTFSSTTPVTDNDVTRFIEEADAEIDAMLAFKYEVPITGTAALIVVRSLSIALVADRIRSIIAVKSGNEKVDQAAGKTDGDKAREKLSKIAKGEIKLVGATLAQADDGVESYATDESFAPTFSRDEEQW